MGAVRRAAKFAAVSLGGLLYLWFAAVRNVDRIKDRKAARRRERLARRSVRAG